MSDRAVIINDVGPRDGLQSQSKILTPAERLKLIRALLDAGVNHIEVGAFVSPRAVPAMAGAAEILAGLPDVTGARYCVLVPNFKGYELAREAGATLVSLVLYGTDSMAQKNVGMSRTQADEAAVRILTQAQADGVHVTATISVAFECPFEGAVDADVVEDTAARMLEAGANEVCIADTIGAADPGRVSDMMSRLAGRWGAETLSCHFHDTRAMGLANVYAAIESGIRKFDTSIGGLGGCPFAPGASGNVATEDVTMMLQQMGFETGIDLEKLIAASELARELTGTAPGGRSLPWLRGRLGREAAA